MSDIDAFEGNVGNPKRGTKTTGDDAEQENPNSKEQPGKSPGGSSTEGSGEDSTGSDRDRKRRITVTPNDYEELQDTADEMGTSKAGVYNRAFQRLKEQEAQVVVSPKNPDDLEAVADALGLSREGVYRFALQRLLSGDTLEIDV